jgi:hypothetical protein
MKELDDLTSEQLKQLYHEEGGKIPESTKDEGTDIRKMSSSELKGMVPTHLGGDADEPEPWETVDYDDPEEQAENLEAAKLALSREMSQVHSQLGDQLFGEFTRHTSGGMVKLEGDELLSSRNPLKTLLAKEMEAQIEAEVTLGNPRLTSRKSSEELKRLIEAHNALPDESESANRVIPERRRPRPARSEGIRVPEFTPEQIQRALLRDIQEHSEEYETMNKRRK